MTPRNNNRPTTTVRAVSRAKSTLRADYEALEAAACKLSADDGAYTRIVEANNALRRIIRSYFPYSDDPANTGFAPDDGRGLTKTEWQELLVGHVSLFAELANGVLMAGTYSLEPGNTSPGRYQHLIRAFDAHSQLANVGKTIDLQYETEPLAKKLGALKMGEPKRGADGTLMTVPLYRESKHDGLLRGAADIMSWAQSNPAVSTKDREEIARQVEDFKEALPKLAAFIEQARTFYEKHPKLDALKTTRNSR